MSNGVTGVHRAFAFLVVVAESLTTLLCYAVWCCCHHPPKGACPAVYRCPDPARNSPLSGGECVVEVGLRPDRGLPPP